MACLLGFAEANLLEGYCADLLPVSVGTPRSIRALGISDFLVLDRQSQRIVLVHDTDDDGMVDIASQIASMNGLNHGLALYDGYVYASSSETVYRWPFQIGNTQDVSDQVEIVINNMEPGGQGGAPWGHSTRTLEFDSDGTFYVQIGSAGNVDSDARRSRVRRFFEIRDGNSQFPIDYQGGEVFADGLRNTVGLSFDRHGVLWGVENGADRLYRQDLGGDIHNENPAEELNRLSEDLAGQSWGYPYCWTEFILPAEYGGGIDTPWAWPSTMNTYDDDYCRSNTQQSTVAIQAHSAVLGIVFYRYNESVPEGCTGTFPPEMDGYAFMTYHGSWNRDIPTGYKVTYIPMTEDGFVPEGQQPIDLLTSAGNNARWGNGFRPVDVDFDECGRLLVTSDGSRGRGAAVVRISYEAAVGGENDENGDNVGDGDTFNEVDEVDEVGAGADAVQSDVIDEVGAVDEADEVNEVNEVNEVDNIVNVDGVASDVDEDTDVVDDVSNVNVVDDNVDNELSSSTTNAETTNADIPSNTDPTAVTGSSSDAKPTFGGIKFLMLAVFWNVFL